MRGDSGNLIYSTTTIQMTLGLVLNYRIGERFDIERSYECPSLASSYFTLTVLTQRVQTP